MTDPLPLLVIFAIGFVAGRMFPALWADRLLWAIKRRTPRRCPSCGVWCWTGDMEMARHKLAGWVRVCHRCYTQHYTPFSKE